MDGLIKKEYMNGEISGIETFYRLPTMIIEDYSEQLKELKEALQNEREDTEAN